MLDSRKLCQVTGFGSMRVTFRCIRVCNIGPSVIGSVPVEMMPWTAPSGTRKASNGGRNAERKAETFGQLKPPFHRKSSAVFAQVGLTVGAMVVATGSRLSTFQSTDCCLAAHLAIRVVPCGSRTTQVLAAENQQNRMHVESAAAK